MKKLTIKDIEGLLLTPNDLKKINTGNLLHKRVMEELKKPENQKELEKGMANYNHPEADF
ncbi:MAG TPA: hypothetical protein VMZ91_02070 [Candidatus Paceibacterota bacterium]|nr:hypothetical protein [Candidatus Paceibacterota bacterium]